MRAVCSSYGRGFFCPGVNGEVVLPTYRSVMCSLQSAPVDSAYSPVAHSTSWRPFRADRLSVPLHCLITRNQTRVTSMQCQSSNHGKFAPCPGEVNILPHLAIPSVTGFRLHC